ncbi:MAG: glutaminyl-peptide cyclotransferase [Humidesulfovibrio sp.]|nr:glutaminyl-peptide cyclotransferase [Humidesulfovibrio sp.]
MNGRGTFPWLLAALLVLCLPGASPAAPSGLAPTEVVRVLARLPHDSKAFTQGFFLHHGVYFESTGLYGQSTVRRVDPATGRVLTWRGLPEAFFGEGLALCPAKGRGARLVQLTWREGVILTYDPESLRPLGRHRLRGQGWGLTCRGDTAVLSDGTDVLRFLDARTLEETGKTLRVREGTRPIERINELEWVNGWLVANIWQEDILAVIRPSDGQVALWLDLSALRRELPDGAEAANGVAFDPAADSGRGALLLTGKLWDRVFVAALPELLHRQPGGPGNRP